MQEFCYCLRWANGTWKNLSAASGVNENETKYPDDSCPSGAMISFHKAAPNFAKLSPNYELTFLTMPRFCFENLFRT